MNKKQWGAGDSVTMSCPTLETPWTAVCQAPLSMGFSRHWSGLPFYSPGDLPDPGIEPRSPALQADALTSEPPGLQNKKLFIKIFVQQIMGLLSF